jgi:hypothetical protein
MASRSSRRFAVDAKPSSVIDKIKALIKKPAPEAFAGANLPETKAIMSAHAKATKGISAVEGKRTTSEFMSSLNSDRRTRRGFGMNPDTLNRLSGRARNKRLPITMESERIKKMQKNKIIDHEMGVQFGEFKRG